MFKELAAKKRKMDKATAASQPGHGGSGGSIRNPFLSQPVLSPVSSLGSFLLHVRKAALEYLPKEQQRNLPIRKPFCEVEARLGILTVPHTHPPRRVATPASVPSSAGPPPPAFDCSRAQVRPGMEAGVSKSHYAQWTAEGTHSSTLRQAFGLNNSSDPSQRLTEHEKVETVYAGYSNGARVCFTGLDHTMDDKTSVGTMESKEKLTMLDWTLPAAPYDLRVTLSSENIMDPAVRARPPNGWTSRRLKRRRSYSRHPSFAWQLDVTEVTTTPNATRGIGLSAGPPQVSYEIELELHPQALLDLINEADDAKRTQKCQSYANQCWWILSQLNPLADALNVEERLQMHPNSQAVKLALAHCGALKRFLDGKQHTPGSFVSPLSGSPDQPVPSHLSNMKFMGAMPVNFTRHDLEEIQRSEQNAYYLSEKTDGVRHLLVFTGDTAVLVDRAMDGKQIRGSGSGDPMAPYLAMIQPGTVFDGEVVMNRKNPNKPRPIFIVFDVLSISATQPILHLSFGERLEHLRKSSFAKPNSRSDPMSTRSLGVQPPVPLPLIRKNFVTRTQISSLLDKVHEERGMRCYRNGDAHNHLTDGIIFQPNRAYVAGTDVRLLKWKYLDTVTMDVELLAPQPNYRGGDDDDDEKMRSACVGEEGSMVDLSRFVQLPRSERMRLEADKFAAIQSKQGKGKWIAEVGLDPETGEWYYLTLRPDKIAANHISTVLGTLMELAERLTSEELRFRLSLPPGTRDTYRKDFRNMMQQMLKHQQRRLEQQSKGNEKR